MTWRQRWLSAFRLGAGPAKAGGGAAPTYTISGTIYDNDGTTPLTGVLVTLSGDASDSMTTSGDGAYTFTVNNGSYTVTPTKAGYAFTAASEAVVVSGGAVAVDDMDGDTIYLSLPFAHMWNDEVNGALPSHCAAAVTGMNVPTISTQNPGSSYNRSCYMETGGTEIHGKIDMLKPIDPAAAGLRILLLALGKSGSNAYEQAYLDAETGAAPGGTDNAVYWRLQQNSNPDYLAHFKRILTTTDYNNTGQGASVNYATGAAWHYYRFEVLKTGETTFQIFNTAGAQVMPLTSFGAQGSLSYFPSGMQFLHINGVNGGSSACAQVWVGLSSDAWPAMPMTPLSTY